MQATVETDVLLSERPINLRGALASVPEPLCVHYGEYSGPAGTIKRRLKNQGYRIVNPEAEDKEISECVTCGNCGYLGMNPIAYAKNGNMGEGYILFGKCRLSCNHMQEI